MFSSLLLQIVGDNYQYARLALAIEEKSSLTAERLPGVKFPRICNLSLKAASEQRVSLLCFQQVLSRALHKVAKLAADQFKPCLPVCLLLIVGLTSLSCRADRKHE